MDISAKLQELNTAIEKDEAELITIKARLKENKIKVEKALKLEASAKEMFGESVEPFKQD